MGFMRALVLAWLLAWPGMVLGQEQPADQPAQVQELLRLLAAPEVQRWLSEHATGAADGGTASTVGDPAPLDGFIDELHIEAAVAHWHAHRDMIIQAVPGLPRAIGDGLARLSADAKRGGFSVVLVLVAVFVAAGFAAEWLFSRITRQARRRVLAADETTVKERLHKVALRLGLAIGATIAFATASIGIFVMIDLPPLIREVGGRLLLAAVIFRLIRYMALVLLAPKAPARRIMPIDDRTAAFWLTRVSAFVGVFVFGWAVASSLIALDIPRPYPLIIAYVLGLGLVAVAIETIWRRPESHGSAPPVTAEAGLADEPPALSPEPRAAPRGGGVAVKLALSAYAILVFMLWLLDARILMWLALVAAFLPMALSVTCYAVNNLLRPIGQAMDDAEGPPSVAAAAIERGARALLIVAAVAFLSWTWEIDLHAIAGGEAELSPLMSAFLNIAIIAIVFDFIWHVGRTAIDRYLSGAVASEHVTADEARRRARIRTLLPIGRSMLQVVLVVTAVLMVLASLGVQIAPLIAGAGVVGVAIGFGSQTLVRDIVSGMFYLLDDAFRVGEYIIAGNQKGTVEGFSLRSLKLRHHRGSLYTIPFGSLGSIRNMSREWVIEKLSFTVPFDSDIARIKKVVKQVSAELLADPELGPNFIEPLKSQGADTMVDHGFVVRLKFMSKPGKQFPIRRRAWTMLQKAFAENGIAFALPTVRVSGGEDQAAAAKAALDAKAMAEAQAAAE